MGEGRQDACAPRAAPAGQNTHIVQHPDAQVVEDTALHTHTHTHTQGRAVRDWKARVNGDSPCYVCPHAEPVNCSDGIQTARAAQHVVTTVPGRALT